jgi:hypothetical protein
VVVLALRAQVPWVVPDYAGAEAEARVAVAAAKEIAAIGTAMLATSPRHLWV